MDQHSLLHPCEEPSRRRRVGGAEDGPFAMPPCTTHRPNGLLPLGVILADGHAILRQGLAALLAAQADIAVLAQVADGEAAWQSIQTERPDIAILDLIMRGITGIEVARRVETAGLPTRCLLLTMHDDAATALRAIQAGAAGYVLKSDGFEDLMLALRSIAAGGTFLTPSLRPGVRALQRSSRKPVALSPREQEVVRLLSAGKSSKEIGRALAISPRTVDTHRYRVMEKLGVHSATEVVRYAVQRGMLG